LREYSVRERERSLMLAVLQKTREKGKREEGGRVGGTVWQM